MINRFQLLLILVFLIVPILVISGCDYITGAAVGEPALSQQTIININATEAYALVQANEDSPDFIIIDVRTTEEFNNGHIKNAFLVSYNTSDFKEKIGKFDRDKKYLIYCQTGGRSSGALHIMEELGFCYIYHMDGGITGWLAQDLPLVK